MVLARPLDLHVVRTGERTLECLTMKEIEELMAGKAKKAPTTEEQVQEIARFATGLTNPGVIAMATFDALAVVARGIDELRAETKELRELIAASAAGRSS